MIRTLHLLAEPGQPVELRALGVVEPAFRKPHIVSGYFTDWLLLVKAAAALTPISQAVYVTLNPITPALLARAHNRVKPAQTGSATSDRDVTGRRWLLVDLDPVRPAGISSTDAEHAAASARAKEIAKALTAAGWPEPAEGDSGNGAHRLWQVDLPADDGGLLARVLMSLAFRFDDEQVRADTTVHNPARISKLYGTIARKGDNTPDRPHRLARLLSAPAEIVTVTRDQLEAVAAWLPKAPAPEPSKNGHSKFDIDSWLAEHVPGAVGPNPWQQGGRKWILPVCPWDPSHTDRSAYIVEWPGGKLGAGCHHNGCQGRDWHALRDLLEPGARDRRASPGGHSPNGHKPPEPERPDEAAFGAGHPHSQSTLLVELAEENLVDQFRDGAGTAYGCARINGHRETMRIRTMAFREWLGQLFYKQQQKTPGGQALQDAINVLAGKAKFDGPERMVCLRVGELAGNLYLDLGDPRWRAVKISPAGWETVTTTPVYFWRARGMGALPAPAAGGNLDELRSLINVSDDDFYLMVGWLLACFRPSGPYPVLDLVGEAGTAKTTTARSLKGLVDPGEDGARAEPREVRDLMIAAKNHWVLSYDNLSYLPDWLSDALCRLSTGGGFGTRELYTNDEEIFLSAQRPVILNGIEDVITRGDLLDRALPITLPVIDDTVRREERAYWAAFEAARPRIIGALLDAVVLALRTVDYVQLDRLPRMADFARWVTAAEPALGWPRGAFLRAYLARQREANEFVLTAARISTPLLKVVADAGGNLDRTYTDLLQDLLTEQPELGQDKKRPLNARRLAGELRRIAPNLRKLGINVQVGRPEKRQPRRVVITRAANDEADPNLENGLMASERPQERPQPEALIQAELTIKEPVEADEAVLLPTSSVRGYEEIDSGEEKDSSGAALEGIRDGTASTASTASFETAEADWRHFGNLWTEPFWRAGVGTQKADHVGKANVVAHFE